ncbi:phosphotransferase-like protein [Rhizobium multihospitium]|uniref:Chloramphenicol 3-O phosphotransferase n=1 Tax=Rhizobium multihospitium TaxID=410764 RepID=A0A1C3X7X3_9HYPH|nr:adenylyl-sulfate kinase [Rhizobium multihospitium]SCB48363.1 chloramphenicol 3-O phosphotransferase [Rhizobium multihospitium]
MIPGRIIFLNGTSSAGKSTLAKALREVLPEFCYYASDQLADAGFRALKRNAAAGSPGERSRFFDGFHRSIAAFANAGNDLIVEHIVEEQSWADHLESLLANLDVFWVGVHAPIEEVERRERERGNRYIGEARYHLKTHNYCRYDLEIDTTRPLDTLVALIVEEWEKRRTAAT